MATTSSTTEFSIPTVTHRLSSVLVAHRIVLVPDFQIVVVGFGVDFLSDIVLFGQKGESTMLGEPEK